MKHFIVAGFVLLAHFCSSQELLTPELLWKMNRISGGTVSPDGQFLLYSQRSYDLEANKGNTDLFVLDLKRNKTQQITATPFTEMEAQWGINNTIRHRVACTYIQSYTRVDHVRSHGTESL